MKRKRKSRSWGIDGCKRAGYLHWMTGIFDIADHLRLIERFFGAARSVLARA
jgi:hypothetical protein